MKKTLVMIAFFLIHLSCMYSEPSQTLPEGRPGEITFVGDAGSPNTFSVKRWRFDAIDNLEEPEQLIVKATLDISSIETPWSDMLKSVLKKKDYFHYRKFGTAEVNINGATAHEDGSFSTDAELTLKGITKIVPLTFTLSGTDTVKVEAQGIVMRREFSFTGEGPKDEVPVSIRADLVLSTEHSD